MMMMVNDDDVGVSSSGLSQYTTRSLSLFLSFSHTYTTTIVFFSLSWSNSSGKRDIFLTYFLDNQQLSVKKETIIIHAPPCHQQPTNNNVCVCVCVCVSVCFFWGGCWTSHIFRFLSLGSLTTVSLIVEKITIES
jgi:hypothetical protein